MTGGAETEAGVGGGGRRSRRRLPFARDTGVPTGVAAASGRMSFISSAYALPTDPRIEAAVFGRSWREGAINGIDFGQSPRWVTFPDLLGERDRRIERAREPPCRAPTGGATASRRHARIGPAGTGIAILREEHVRPVPVAPAGTAPEPVAPRGAAESRT